MSRVKRFVWETGIMMATTVGAGMFALPYVFSRSGWLIGTLHLGVLSALIVSVHLLYWNILDAVKEKNRLLGLSEVYFGKGGFFFSAFVIIGGLLLALVVYLILGSQFMRLIFPVVGNTAGIAIFWVICSLPLLLGLPRLAWLESLATVLMVAIVFFILFTSGATNAAAEPAFALKNLFFPFGAILFALAGWTAVEPMYELDKGFSSGKKTSPAPVLLVGTFAAAVLYLLFILGIFGSAGQFTPDAVSGLTNWLPWKLGLLGMLGLFAIWTSYVPISLEIKNSLARDMRWSVVLSSVVVVFVPLVLTFAGFQNFLKIVGVAGGLFLSLQYVLIILIGRKVLALTPLKRFLLDILTLVFILAAVYSAAQFFN
jgi:amino acid permease